MDGMSATLIREPPPPPQAADSAGGFEPHRPALLRLAYRLLADRAAAEDMVQETWLRWHQTNRAGIESPRAWLVTACTRLCLDELRSARARRETYVGPWLPEPLVEPAAPPDPVERHEDLSIAFLLLLDRLKPVERAAFVLRRVFELDYEAIGRAVGKSALACRQLVSRAGRRIEAEPPLGQPEPELTRDFVAALAAGDQAGLMRLLAGDAVLLSDGGGKAIAALNPILGPDHIARFLLGIRRKFNADVQIEAARVNGGPGLILRRAGGIHSVFGFAAEAGRIARLYVIRNPDKLRFC